MFSANNSQADLALIYSTLTFIGEQEQLKKLSDNFGLSKKKVFGQGSLTLTEKVKKNKDNFNIGSVGKMGVLVPTLFHCGS